MSVETSRTLFHFTGQIDAFSAKLGIAFEVALRRLALEIYNGVTLKTPVDTGRARASWNLTRGQIDLSVVPDPGDKKLGSAYVAAKHAAQIENLAGVTPLAAGPLGRAYLVPPVYITNNLPYVIYLENGSSEQAPQGMVVVTLAEVESRLRTAIRKL